MTEGQDTRYPGLITSTVQVEEIPWEEWPNVLSRGKEKKRDDGVSVDGGRGDINQSY